MIRVFTIFALFLLLGASAGAELVVNEALSNEPGGEVALEWCELYNPGIESVNLSFYELYTFSSGTADSCLLDGEIGPDSYAVICRNQTRFEEHFGDSSGVWGDDESEQYELIEKSIHLSNDSGSITLRRLNSPVSQLRWTEPGDDGVSWERVEPDSDQILPSVDQSGSTPGYINSHTRTLRDLALDSVSDSVINGLTYLNFQIANRGRTPVLDGVLRLYHYDESAPDYLGLPIASETLGDVDSGFAFTLVAAYPLSRAYQPLVALIDLADDDRPENNRVDFTARGEQFPAILLSEFLANPVGQPDSEWVEIKNVADETINLINWQLGDEIGLGTISTEPLSLAPGERLVLVQSEQDFAAAYPMYGGDPVLVAPWRTLNNSGDVVRLLDQYGNTSDRFEYATVFDSNHTWCRAEMPEDENRWGRSETAGGTPGEGNVVRFTGEPNTSISINIEPRVFSPDGDGYQDSAVITVNAPPGSSTLKIYDAHGRLVRTLEEDAPDLAAQYVWDGTSDAGSRLPIGIYILYFEVGDAESAKRTLVIAR